MQRADLEAALKCLRHRRPSTAQAVEIVELDGASFATRSLVDASADREQTSVHPVISDPARGLALLAKLPRAVAEAALANLAPDGRDEWMERLPLTQAQGFGFARSLSGGSWVSAQVPGHPSALALHMPAATLVDDANAAGRDLAEAARLAAGGETASQMSIAAQRRPQSAVTAGLECVHDAHALLGEGPVWNPTARTLDWVDVLGPTIWAHDPATGENISWKVRRLVTAVLPAVDTSRLVVGEGGLSRLAPATSQLVRLRDPERERPTHRLNDAKCDSRGRIWAGSMRLDASVGDGSLFRFASSTSSAERADTGFLVANGLGWSPDDRTMYFTDTGAGTIFAYDFDAQSGDISNRRVFLKLPPESGRPDGLTVDAAGNVWVAIWDGWRVVRLTPDGRQDREITMPVPRPTSCCFGGEDRRTLFITSARIRLSAEELKSAPLSGALFRIEVDTPGLSTNLASSWPVSPS